MYLRKLINVVIKVFLITQFSSIYCNKQVILFIGNISMDDIISDIKEYFSDEDYKNYKNGGYLVCHKEEDEDGFRTSIYIRRNEIRLYSRRWDSKYKLLEIAEKYCGESKIDEGDNETSTYTGNCTPKKKVIVFDGYEEGNKVNEKLNKLKDEISKYHNKEYFLLFEEQVKKKIMELVRKIVGNDSIVTFEDSSDSLRVKIKGLYKLKENPCKKSHKYILLTDAVVCVDKDENYGDYKTMPGLDDIEDFKGFESNSLDKITFKEICKEVATKVNEVIIANYPEFKWENRYSVKEYDPRIIFCKKEEDYFCEIKDKGFIENSYELYYVVDELLIRDYEYGIIMNIIGATEKINKNNTNAESMDKITDIEALKKLKSDINDDSLDDGLSNFSWGTLNDWVKNNIIPASFYGKAKIVEEKRKLFIDKINSKIFDIEFTKCLEEEIKPLLKKKVEVLVGKIKLAPKAKIYELVKHYIVEDCKVTDGRTMDEIKYDAVDIYIDKILGDKYIEENDGTDEYEFQKKFISKIESYYSSDESEEVKALVKMLNKAITTKFQELKITNINEIKVASKGKKKGKKKDNKEDINAKNDELKKTELNGTTKDDKKDIDDENEEVENKELKREKLEKIVKKAEENTKKLKEEENKREEKLKSLKDKEIDIGKKINKTVKKPDDKTKKDTKTKQNVDTQAHTGGGCCRCCKCCKKLT